MTLAVAVMLPPTEVLLIVNPPICNTHAGASVVVPVIVMLFAVMIEATLLYTARPSVAPPLKITLPAVDVSMTE